MVHHSLLPIWGMLVNHEKCGIKMLFNWVYFAQKTSKRNLEGLESISGGLGIASEAEVEVVSRGKTSGVRI